MIKRYVFALQEINGRTWLWRFRSRDTRAQWLEEQTVPAGTVPGTHSEVRRIYRRISQGEAVIFPVMIGD